MHSWFVSFVLQQVGIVGVVGVEGALGCWEGVDLCMNPENLDFCSWQSPRCGSLEGHNSTIRNEGDLKRKQLTDWPEGAEPMLKLIV